MTQLEALRSLITASGPKCARAALRGNATQNLKNAGFLRGLLRTHRRLSSDEVDRLIGPMLGHDRPAPSIESTIHTLQIIAAF